MSRFSQAEFITSVNDLKDLPSHTGTEIAFAGRSNAGKSSALNAIVGRKLAFVSKTPGRTQLINFFDVGHGGTFVDLPGYGYASVPVEVRNHWQELLAAYLETRENLTGLVLISDVRHALTPLDWQMLEWFAPSGKPVHILLSKSDKLSRNQAAIALSRVKQTLPQDAPVTVQLFSSLKQDGVEHAQMLLESWLRQGSAIDH